MLRWLRAYRQTCQAIRPWLTWRSLCMQLSPFLFALLLAMLAEGALFFSLTLQSLVGWSLPWVLAALAVLLLVLLGHWPYERAYTIGHPFEVRLADLQTQEDLACAAHQLTRALPVQAAPRRRARL